jgi:tetratricopeptide (TPR) repeat protein
MSISLPGSLDENARRRFEAAWCQGKPEPIEHFLPPPNDAGYRATLEELVHIDLEFSWKTGKPSGESTFLTGTRPGLVEAYLTRFPCLRESACVRRLLEQEYLVRHLYGDRPAVSEYQARFPEVIVTGQEFEGLLEDSTTLPQQGRVSARSPGSRLDHYRLSAEHGRGGFGLVWRADDENLGREVALKQLSEELATHTSYRQRFLAEARIAARLQHPGIVPVYELSAAEVEHPYYTMKLVRGETLSEAIRAFHEAQPPGERALANQRLLAAFLAVARAMAYSHSRGIIHRDLKPDNIVLGDYGETVILDWGLAKVRDSQLPAPAAAPVPGYESAPAMVTQPGTVMGTPAYMSPEQAAGRIEEVDERSDVYALGAILYQLLTGAPPYQGSSSGEILEQVVSRAPAPPRSVDPRIPRPLEAICLRAMARDREHRYAEVALLVRDLEHYLADEPMVTYRGTWEERARRWARHHRTVVATAVVALVLGVAGAVGGLFLWQTEEHRREQQAAKYLADLQRSAVDGEAFALAELRAGRFTGAEKILRHALAALQDEPKLEDYRSRLETQWQRTQGLVDFYRLADKAEKLAFLESDAEALAASEGALTSLGILHDREWAAHLPAADLTDPADADPEHLLRQLREDVYRTIGLLAALYVRPVLLKGTDDPKTQEACRSALETVEMFHCFRPSVSGRLIELFCYLRLGQLHRVLAWKPVAEPTSATDYYFSGIAHLWLAAAEQNDDIRRLLELPVTRALIGLDFRKARQTSERYLRTAADREPRHYWTQFWLAWSLSVAGNFSAAAQAYDTCVALRPDYALAYAQRGQLLILQMPQTSEVDRRRELERRGLEDLNRAQTLEPDEPFIHWLRANALAHLGRVPDALEVFGRAMELERPLAEWKGQHIAQEKQLLLQQAVDFAKAVTARDPGQVEAWAVLATAQLALGQTAEARTAAGRALQLRADHARALAVWRAVQLQGR